MSAVGFPVLSTPLVPGMLEQQFNPVGRVACQRTLRMEWRPTGRRCPVCEVAELRRGVPVSGSGFVGRTVAQEGERVAVDPMPATLEALHCPPCGVTFFAPVAQ